MSAVSIEELGWELLGHGGLLVDPPRLRDLASCGVGTVTPNVLDDWRRKYVAFRDDKARASDWVSSTLEHVCGFSDTTGSWLRGNSISTEWSHKALTGEVVRPRSIWKGNPGGTLPVFIDDQHPQIGKGRGRKTVSNVLQWMRAKKQPMALLTNGRQWRLMHAGLDSDAFCEWDADRWFEAGTIGQQVHALRLFLQPAVWRQSGEDTPSRLLQAVQDSRKGQAELSATLGERVREAVELLIQAHGEQLRHECSDVDTADIYRAAVRVVMRLVVVLFAESRDLLPRSNTLYHRAYGVNGLLEELEKHGGKSGERLANAFSAWPRLLGLFRLVHDGCPHPSLPIHAYGGDLFETGSTNDLDGLKRSLTVFESACYQHQVMSNKDVLMILDRISRTRVKVRQGRSSTWITAPVDFSDLSSEYIGILYEGLLDYELKSATDDDPVIFLAVGSEPALPLSRLEAMSDSKLKELFESMKDTSKSGDDEGQEEDAEPFQEELQDAESDEEEAEAINDDDQETADEEIVDARRSTRLRAEDWARRAVIVTRLVKAKNSAKTPEHKAAYERSVHEKAKQLVRKVILPGEWFLVRWGGTRKGAGTFYTRPGLSVPTVHRTLRPLAYTAPTNADGTANTMAPAARWTPKLPEEILSIKVCDPACGSGSFPVAALRFLTEAMYASLHHHGRIAAFEDRAIVSLLQASGSSGDTLGTELIPARPDDEVFEARLKARLRRHVVERCIYGVDLDPLAVELCRLALWIETMDRDLPFSFLDHKIKCGNGLIGAWFDQFQHYPVMAWKKRDAGDEKHTNGVHFTKGARTAAIKDWVKNTLTPDLRLFLQGSSLFSEDLQEKAARAHEDALAVLNRLHEMPVHDAAERSRLYRTELIGSASYQQLKAAMDLWCACWFWPAYNLGIAPLPSTLTNPSEETLAEARRIAQQLRFFHWELEFPDVFRAFGDGFDAMIGNPPWETLQPNSKEYFSNVDPLYRTYGKQVALKKQTDYFSDIAIEQDWIAYNDSFSCFTCWMKYVANPFGDPVKAKTSDKQFSIGRGKESEYLHDRWRSVRNRSKSYASADKPFQYNGDGKAYTYKLFLESSLVLIRDHGRMGMIVPSGVYSDAGSTPLRKQFLDHCNWEWLFGFENRNGIFEIHRSFKFNPIIVEKGGSTQHINTAFMRRDLSDWEHAEDFAVGYGREQVDRFSPKSLAILEIQSQKDLEILEKIYANSVLLGDDGPNGWGVKYAQGDFNMTSDSHLFPPRPKWEEQGYRPDEYSRWLKGAWRPIDQLWTEIGINPANVVPADIILEDWLFDTTAGPERRTAEAKFVHGHLLKPGDVARTNARLRCAQPPYDSLPIPRADIPAGIILSREADAWIREEKIEDVALPLYEGRMIGQFDFSQKGWVSGKGRSAVWRDVDLQTKHIEPQYLMARDTFWNNAGARARFKSAMMDVTSSTNTRTTITGSITGLPSGHKSPVLRFQNNAFADGLRLVAVFNSFIFDFLIRLKLGGNSLIWSTLSETFVPFKESLSETLLLQVKDLSASGSIFAEQWLSTPPVRPWKSGWAVNDAQRNAIRINVDSAILGSYSVTIGEERVILSGCDQPLDYSGIRDPKGFWRVDKDKDPELRHTVLTIIAFQDLQKKIEECGGDRDKGIEAFLNQNNGEGWMLPETLRLADYGLGHDDRALEHQPVASRLGPRFYDWQLAHTAEESWRECHLHARNMLGADEYQRLLDRIEAEKRGEVWVDERDNTNTAEIETTSRPEHQIGMGI